MQPEIQKISAPHLRLRAGVTYAAWQLCTPCNCKEASNAKHGYSILRPSGPYACESLLGQTCYLGMPCQVLVLARWLPVNVLKQAKFQVTSRVQGYPIFSHRDVLASGCTPSHKGPTQYEILRYFSTGFASTLVLFQISQCHSTSRKVLPVDGIEVL